MKLRNTAILAILFAAFAGYLYYVELPRGTNESSADAALSFDIDAVSHIELEHPGRKVVLEQQDGQWMMIEPVDAPADHRNVQNLLRTVQECVIKRTLGDVDDLAPYGLDFPSASILLEAGDEDVGTLKVGKKTPVGGSAYLMRNDDTSVHLTDVAFFNRIDQKAEDLRDKTVLTFDKETVRSLEVRGARGDVALEKPGDTWKITEPSEYDADQTQIANLLSSLESLRATDFVDESPDKLDRYGLGSPRSTVTLGFAEGEPLELRISSEREGKLRVQSSQRSTVYAVASWAGNTFDKNVNDFRDKSIARFAAEDASEIEIETPSGTRIGLKKSDNGWQSISGDAEVEQAGVNELLRELSSLTGFEVAVDAPDNLADFGLDPPRRSVRVHDGEGALLAAITLGSHAVDGARVEYTALAEGSTTVFHIRDFEFERINKGQDLLVEPTPSESTATPVPDGNSSDGVDDDALDDTAPAGEEG